MVEVKVKKDMTVAILSWKAHETLINTLESYEKYGLVDAQKLIFFQEISKEDEEIALRYGYSPIGDKSNIGIGPAYAELVKAAKGDFFLFLENDWELLRDPHNQLYAGEILLYQGAVDSVRYRDRENPGWPLWSKQFEGRELDRPEFLLESVHWREPGVDYPEKVRILSVEFTLEDGLEEEHNFSVTKARYANWTNNPTLFRTQWLKDNILNRLEGDVEKAIQSWWLEQDFRIAHGQGLFTHSRLDR